MYKTTIRWVALGLLAVSCCCVVSSTATAAEKDKQAETGSSQKAARQARAPFHGKLAGVDKKQMTLTLEGKERQRIIRVTADTRIMKAGKPGTLDDAIVGEEVAGQLTRNAAGEEEAVSLRFGPKPEEAEPKRKSAKPASGN